MAYYIHKTFSFSASHKLNLDYDSPCSQVHGHNWKVTVYFWCSRLELPKNGMVVDFGKIKNHINNFLDHKHLNDVIEQPTAENIARFIFDKANELVSSKSCYKVIVEESDGSVAEFHL